MKKYYLSILLIGFILMSFAQVTINPDPFEVNESITITLDTNSSATDCNGFSNPSKVYMHSGVGDGSNAFGISVTGNWGQDDGLGEMINQGGGIYSITIVPETYYNLTTQQASNVIQMGMVFRNEDGSQEYKATGCNDFIFQVGTFQISLTAPIEDTTIINSGSDFSIAATNIGGNANYTLTSNGTIIDNQPSTDSYSYTDLNITENKSYELTAVLDGTTITKIFNVIIDPGGNIGFMSSNYEEGINYIDDNTAVLVLYAAGKDFIYVAGSFNNYQPDITYAMKRDVSRNLFWLELTGLTPGQIETYEYWAGDKTPGTNSPSIVKVADPYSTLILSRFDDPFIPASTYPNLPSFPDNAGFEVSVLQTGQTPYNWEVTNFTKPKKEDLIVYEVLVRDFDSDRNYQDLIDKIDYFKNLNINAIHLMPVMEFEGNESWGYNTSYHMALDKFYGTEDKLKEFIDLCHQNDIAVILDLVLNHAFGRSPMVRMWISDADGNGFGDPTSQNPYFNQQATHSYSVGYDYNHQNTVVQNYVKRVIKHWVEDFKIDGFRWDLTKGFTQNCTANDEGCTNAYQQDRIDVLREYADYSWTLDDDHFVIFEHLGSDSEEKEWANYRLDEGKGIMMWGKMTDPYNELTMGQNGDRNINRIGHLAHAGFNGPRVMGYPESHDEERLMYKNLQFGSTSNPSHNVQELNVALSRMSALAAVSVMVPGPKMIWHFGDLGMENSIFTCNNGIVNLPGDGDGNGDCKLDTKPQPQWANNWLTDAIRSEIYSDWSRLHALKINEPVFEGDYTMSSGNFTPRIDIFDNSIPTTQLRNVIILANFDVTTQSVNTNFPAGITSTWYDLMDPSGSTTIANSTTSISIPAGQFRILGNAQAANLSIDEEALLGFSIYPNPTTASFSVNTNVSDIEIYDLTGKLVKSFKGDFNRTNSFDISSLTTGIYIVKVENNNNQVKTTKLVKL
jgi:1,4-alpha-glucan branching enzyme